ncbi:MAG: 4-(cytidine 5'-diphospho)-2-C-methyl-D-erythritol kinase [Dehalococcoidia bacterium]|nr:MAG: 4-(cytidine 5'-diphospho)-2-C-methyl-D-erythritol kinase [Dehalococcoidia bacterium]
MLTLATPAKINLTLEVLQKRPDGYHEIRSVMQAISLSDRLSFKTNEKIIFQCDSPLWQAEKSLVSRAVDILRRQTNSCRGALIDITKTIPLSSGLGGDSSDAAVVLLGLNRLWELGIPPGDLAQMAGELGSDVPFFLSGGTALAEGRGEFISPLPDMHHAWMVLLLPHVESPEFKTGALYSRLRPEHFTSGDRTDALVARLTRGESIRSCDLCNVFENVAFTAFNGLGKYRDGFENIAAEPVHLAGAGPALCALFSDAEKAARVWRNLKERGLETYLAETQNSAII